MLREAFARWMHIRRAEREIREEMLYHLERRGEEYCSQGLTAAQARSEALKRFGSIEKHRRECRQIATDLPPAIDPLTIHPEASLNRLMMTVVTIGYALLLWVVLAGAPHRFRPALMPDLESLAYSRVPLRLAAADEDGRPSFFAWLRKSQVLDLAAGYQWIRTSQRSDEAQPPISGKSYLGMLVTPEYFEVLEIPPRLGSFPAADSAVGSVVLSNSIWQERYASDPLIVGRTVRLEGRRVEIAAVMPEPFLFLSPSTEFWLFTTPERTPYAQMRVIARLKPGASADQANVEFARIDPSFGHRAFRLVPMHQGIWWPVETAAWLVLATWVPAMVLGLWQLFRLRLFREGIRTGPVVRYWVFLALKTLVQCFTQTDLY